MRYISTLGALIVVVVRHWDIDGESWADLIDNYVDQVSHDPVTPFISLLDLLNHLKNVNWL
jgi:hypothetical protein